MTQSVAPIKVLFVCYGNRCRSPAAEAYARKYAQVHGYGQIFHFSSAGFNSLFGPAEPDTVRVLQEDEGVDMSGFSSQNVCRELVEESDYVVAMEAAQRDTIRGMFFTAPHLAEKIFTLKELAPQSPDPDGSIRDPYEEPIERYRAILHEIKDHVHWAVEEILTREKKRRPQHFKRSPAKKQAKKKK